MSPVFRPRHFQQRVQALFKVIALDGPLGKVKHHSIRMEFQKCMCTQINFFFVDS